MNQKRMTRYVVMRIAGTMDGADSAWARLDNALSAYVRMSDAYQSMPPHERRTVNEALDGVHSNETMRYVTAVNTLVDMGLITVEFIEATAAMIASANPTTPVNALEAYDVDEG